MANTIARMCFVCSMLVLPLSVAAQTIVTLEGGSKVTWGASVETLKKSFSDLAADGGTAEALGTLEGLYKPTSHASFASNYSQIEPSSIGMKRVLQKTVYKTSAGMRAFYFYQNKLYKVIDIYGAMDQASASLLISKIASVYGPSYKKINNYGTTEVLWNYSKNLTVSIMEKDLLVGQGIAVVYFDPVIVGQAAAAIEPVSAKFKVAEEARLKEEQARQAEEQAKKAEEEARLKEEQARVQAEEQAKEQAKAQAKLEEELAKIKSANPLPPNGSMFTDQRDGQTYRAVKIGNKVWMGENLNYEVNGSWCYGDDEFNCKKYGRLYTWNAATTACPSGWRLPNPKEWDALVKKVGKKGAAGKLLAKSEQCRLCSNDYGFSALPGGFRYYHNDRVTFEGDGSTGRWWSAPLWGVSGTYYRTIHLEPGGVYESDYNSSKAGYDGFSVRCVAK